MKKDILAPITSRLKTSLPNLSVPNQKTLFITLLLLNSLGLSTIKLLS